MSRSCQSGTFSRPTSAAARTTRARPEMRSATFGLRLCGIADEPFMPGGERLLDLAHLGAREVADLGREAVERGRAQGERREQLGVPVARDHLGRDRIGLEPEALAGDPLDLGVERRVRADRARRAGRRESPRARDRAASGRGRARTPSLRASSRRSSARRGCRASGRCRSFCRCSSARRTTAASARSSSASRSAPASRICSERAVSTTSEEVRP